MKNTEKRDYIQEAVLKAIEENSDYVAGLRYPINELYPIIGYDGIERLCIQMGGTSIYIPKLYHVFKGAVVDQIKEDYRDGATTREIAKRYGMSERTVRTIV